MRCLLSVEATTEDQIRREWITQMMRYYTITASDWCSGQGTWENSTTNTMCGIK